MGKAANLDSSYVVKGGAEVSLKPTEPQLPSA